MSLPNSANNGLTVWGEYAEDVWKYFTENVELNNICQPRLHIICTPGVDKIIRPGLTGLNTSLLHHISGQRSGGLSLLYAQLTSQLTR